MLASLLPGLRDIRTPLTVGYLWLLVLWYFFGEKIPDKRPTGNGIVARLFDLHAALGVTAALGALSFIAYLLGAIASIPLEGRLGHAWDLGQISRYVKDANNTSAELSEHRRDKIKELLRSNIELSKADWDALERYGIRGHGYDIKDGHIVKTEVYEQFWRLQGVNDLRARLLVANQEMYGEYDRLAAEANFRINLFLPSVVIALIIRWNTGNLFLGFCLVIVAFMFLIRGANRLVLSDMVLERAVLAGVIQDPMRAHIDRIINAETGEKGARHE